MSPQVVIALYRPHEDKDAEFRGLLAQHAPALRSEGLATSRPTLVLKAGDGTYLEIFEWASSEAAGEAHARPAIGRLWDAMERVADFVALNSLAEANRPFAHFEPVALEA